MSQNAAELKQTCSDGSHFKHIHTYEYVYKFWGIGKDWHPCYAFLVHRLPTCLQIWFKLLSLHSEYFVFHTHFQIMNLVSSIPRSSVRLQLHQVCHHTCSTNIYNDTMPSFLFEEVITTASIQTQIIYLWAKSYSHVSFQNLPKISIFSRISILIFFFAFYLIIAISTNTLFSHLIATAHDITLLFWFPVYCSILQQILHEIYFFSDYLH